MFSLKGEFRPFQVVVVPGVLWRTGRHTPIKYSQEYHPLTPPGRCIVTAAKCTKECVARACLLFWSCLLLKDFIQQQKRCSSSECQTNSSTSALIYLYNCKLFFSSFLSITCGQTFQGACKQQRPWRLRKRHEKSEFALLQTLSRLFGYSISFHSSNVRTFLWSWILKKLCRSSVNLRKRKRKLLSWVHDLHKTWSNYSLLGRVMPLSECDLKLQLTLFWYTPPSLKKKRILQSACKILLSIRSTRFP